MPIQGDDGLSGIPWPYRYGVKGESAGNYGVVGLSGGAAGVYGQGRVSGVVGQGGYGVVGVSAIAAPAVLAINEGTGMGLSALSKADYGIFAQTEGQGGLSNRAVYAAAYGNALAVVEAEHFGQGWGVRARSKVMAGAFECTRNPQRPTGAYLGSPADPAVGPDDIAGVFRGDVLLFGKLKATAKSFLIDHPDDPANKYLEHASVESDERKNLYDGVAVLGETGEAEVELPGWFASLNRDFRYQLTCLRGYAPVYIAQEIEGHRFRIAGGNPGLKVSWQITGIRQDPWAQAHPFAVEHDKAETERGLYVEPEIYGEPPEKWVGGARIKLPEPVPAEPPVRPKIEALLEQLKGSWGGEHGETESQP